MKLQPRILSDQHEDHGGVVRMKVVARSYMRWPSEETEEPRSKRQKKDTLLLMFSEILESSTTTAPMSCSAIEVNHYLSEPVVNCKDGDPFTWWSQHKTRFPLLSLLARRYLSATATSVPSDVFH